MTKFKSVLIARFPIKTDFSVTFEAAKNKGLIRYGDAELLPEDFQHDRTRGIEETEVYLLSSMGSDRVNGWHHMEYLPYKEAFEAFGLRPLELPHLVAIAEQYTYDAFRNLESNGVISYRRVLAAPGLKIKNGREPYVWGENSLHIYASNRDLIGKDGCFYVGVPK